MATSALTIILIINSLSLVGLILIQNESVKDAIGSQKSSSNPFEIWTWGFFILQLFILLIKVKANDF